MNLIVDIGNTRTKMAVFSDGEIVKRFSIDAFYEKDFLELVDDYPIRAAIISSVKNDAGFTASWLKKYLDYVLVLDHTVKLPIKNTYKTPETLGKDRIAAAVGANKLYPDADVLVIDAGTAITYDFVNSRNQYEGGFITPGLSMRFKALNHFTERLPLLTVKEPECCDGKNTEESIRGGVQLGLEGEMNRIIEYFSSKKNDLIIILSGGDTKYFEKLLKNHKFVAFEIILLGLNTILESNNIR